MKIAFVVSCVNSRSKGLGGHFHSLLCTATALARNHEVCIIAIGNDMPETLAESKIAVHQLLSDRLTLFGINKTLAKIIGREKPDVVHAFDVISYYWVRIAAKRLKLKCCLTKCGGRNPFYWPDTDNLILFTRENLRWFEGNPRFSSTNLLLLPNRIEKFRLDTHRELEVLQTYPELGAYSHKILRISRIGTYYKRTAVQLIFLVNRLRQDGIDCCGVLLGTVESEEMLAGLREMASSHIYFVTEERFAVDAKQLLGLADVVLGTGRGLMEASFLGRVLLCPTSNSEVPLLINKETFDEAFTQNFSERVLVSEQQVEANYENIKNALSDESVKRELCDFSVAVFDKFFSTEHVSDALTVYYSSLRQIRRTRLLDLALHFLFVLRRYKYRI